MQPSCSLCAKPLTGHSANGLCEACTPNGNQASTPQPMDDAVLANTLSHQSPAFDPTESFDPSGRGVDRLTHVAGAGQFQTGLALPEGQVQQNQIPVIPKYEIINELGRGGCGVVYLAKQFGTNRLVAVKIIQGRNFTEIERFKRETRALGKIKHPGVVEVYEVGECGSGPYYSMEYLAGGSLTDYVKAKPVCSSSETAQLMVLISDALHVVHQAGYLHRDLKPGNILVDADGQPKIADFGLAKAWLADPTTETLNQVTGSHAFLGTPAYMSPEQADCRQDDIDHRSDIHALGGIMYFMLTGEPPFNGKNPAVITHRVINDAPVSVRTRNKEVDRTLEAICLKCLNKAPAERYQSAAELSNDLRCWLTGSPTIAKPISRIHAIAKNAWRLRHALLIPILLISVGIGISLAIGLLNRDDPDAELKKIRKELASGQPVTLLGETGLPRWYNKKNGNVEFVHSEHGGDHCSITTTSQKFVELLPEEDVPESFLLTGEVRHEIQTDPITYAGLYWAYWQDKIAIETERIYWQSLVVDDLPSDHQHKTYGTYFLNSIFINPGFRPKYYDRGLANKVMDSKGYPMGSQWRTLTISVRDSVEFSISPVTLPMSRTSRTKEQLAENRTSLNKDLDVGLKIPERFITKPHLGSLGLFIRNGQASFRNVRLTKL